MRQEVLYIAIGAGHICAASRNVLKCWGKTDNEKEKEKGKVKNKSKENDNVSNGGAKSNQSNSQKLEDKVVVEGMGDEDYMRFGY